MRNYLVLLSFVLCFISCEKEESILIEQRIVAKQAPIDSNDDGSNVGKYVKDITEGSPITSTSFQAPPINPLNLAVGQQSKYVLSLEYFIYADTFVLTIVGEFEIGNETFFYVEEDVIFGDPDFNLLSNWDVEISYAHLISNSSATNLVYSPTSFVGIDRASFFMQYLPKKDNNEERSFMLEAFPQTCTGNIFLYEYSGGCLDTLVSPFDFGYISNTNINGATYNWVNFEIDNDFVPVDGPAKTWEWNAENGLIRHIVETMGIAGAIQLVPG